jgi:hypothetical protein
MASVNLHPSNDSAYEATGGPKTTAFDSQDEFEAKLMEGLKGNGRLLTGAYCAAIKDRFLHRHGEASL